MHKVLIVCSGNICRSPMAEGLLRSHLAEVGARDVVVRSAGTLDIVGSPPAENAVRVCREIRVDIGGLRSSALSRELLGWADVVLGMETEHLTACRERAGRRPLRLALLGAYDRSGSPEISDPVGRNLEAFRRCRDRLQTCVREFVRSEVPGAE